jgi:membrane-bound serine protease (ClpP class)
MLLVAGAAALAVYLHRPWAVGLVAAALLWEIGEKLFWYRRTRAFPIVTGQEALIGLPVTALSPCRPYGRVQLRGERWRARCTDGADPGESLVVESVDRTTLVLRRPPR